MCPVGIRLRLTVLLLVSTALDTAGNVLYANNVQCSNNVVIISKHFSLAELLICGTVCRDSLSFTS